MNFLLRLLINAAALWVAIQLVDGIDYGGNGWMLFAVALVFGVLNASVRPILKLLSLPANQVPQFMRSQGAIAQSTPRPSTKSATHTKPSRR